MQKEAAVGLWTVDAPGLNCGCFNRNRRRDELLSYVESRK